MGGFAGRVGRFGSFLGDALKLCFVRATAQEADDVRAFSGKRRGMFFSCLYLKGAKYTTQHGHKHASHILIKPLE